MANREKPSGGLATAGRARRLVVVAALALIIAGCAGLSHRADQAVADPPSTREQQAGGGGGGM